MSHTSLDDDIQRSRQALASARTSEGASTHRELVHLAHAIEQRYATTWFISDAQERVALYEEVQRTMRKQGLTLSSELEEDFGKLPPRHLSWTFSTRLKPVN